MGIIPSKAVAKRSLCLISAGACVVLAGSVARADEQMLPWRLHHVDHGIWQLTGEFQSLGTTTNYGPAGATEAATGLGSLRRTEVATTLELGLHPRLTLFGRGTWNNTQVVSSTINGNQYGMADQSLGLSLRLVDSRATLDFQVQADLPTYRNTESKALGLPFIGDASTNVHLGGFASMPLSENESRSWKLVAGAGYTMRTAQFSASIPWSAEFTRQPGNSGRGLTLRAGAWGFNSLRNDPRGAGTSNGSGGEGGAGSFLVNAINPSIASAQGSLGFRFSPALEARVGASRTLWGQAAAQGTTMGGSLEWRLDRLHPGGAAFNKRKPKDNFVTYSGQGKVKAVSSTRTLIIDQGSHQGYALGDRVDIFTVNADGSLGEPVARAQITQLDWEQSQATLLEVFRETAIKEGFGVQKPVQQ